MNTKERWKEEKIQVNKDVNQRKSLRKTEEITIGNHSIEAGIK